MEKIKVLLVDDEEEFVYTLAERLNLRNIATLVATNGEEAIRMIESETPPVVVLDVMMPGIGGLDVLKQIKRDSPPTQVILLTGRGSTKDGSKGKRMGAFDYLVKPVRIEEMVKKITEAFEASKQKKQ